MESGRNITWLASAHWIRHLAERKGDPCRKLSKMWCNPQTSISQPHYKQNMSYSRKTKLYKFMELSLDLHISFLNCTKASVFFVLFFYSQNPNWGNYCTTAAMTGQGTISGHRSLVIGSRCKLKRSYILILTETNLNITNF